MVYCSAIGRAFALALAAIALFSGGAASADSIYTITATGIINDAGVDYGVFGNSYGTDLTGQTFTVVENFDIDQSTLNEGDQNQDLSPATVTAAFRQHSPGHLLLLNLVRDAARLELETIDLLRGQEPYKFKWTSVQQPLAAAEWTATLRGRAFALARRFASGQARRPGIDGR